ncbi:MAG TPA: DUF721 domain-containing protein [Pseudomonadales bacterium]|nr:DUF721 domain-containing protein [Pseudomonadales bacterium]
MDQPVPVRAIFAQNSRFQPLLEEAAYVRQLDLAFKTVLDKKFHVLCRVAQFKNGVLQIQVDTSAVATALRFRSRELVQKLGQYEIYKGIKQVDVSTSFRRAEFKLPHKRPNPVSPQTVEMLEQAASDANDVRLEKSLKRLAGTLGLFVRR